MWLGALFGLAVMMFATAPVSSTKTQGDFNLSHRFSVEIDGVSVGGVHSIEGLENEHEIVEYQDGDDTTTHYRPGHQVTLALTVVPSAKDPLYVWSQTHAPGHKTLVLRGAHLNGAPMSIVLNDCTPWLKQLTAAPVPSPSQSPYVYPALNATSPNAVSEPVRIQVHCGGYELR